MPDRLDAGALRGRTVLVQGGAGAVGNAAIQLARWADATVIATVSSTGEGAARGGGRRAHVINYREQDVVAEVRKIAPARGGRDRRGRRRAQRRDRPQVVGAARDGRGLRRRRRRPSRPVRPVMAPNIRWQFVLVYTLPTAAKAQRGRGRATRPPRRARSGSARRPACRCTTTRSSETAEAHQAVQDGAVGKVLVVTGTVSRGATGPAPVLRLRTAARVRHLPAPAPPHRDRRSAPDHRTDSTTRPRSRRCSPTAPRHE